MTLRFFRFMFETLTAIIVSRLRIFKLKILTINLGSSFILYKNCVQKNKTSAIK